MAELARIRKERAEEAQKQAAQEAAQRQEALQQEVATGNPLLNQPVDFQVCSTGLGHPAMALGLNLSYPSSCFDFLFRPCIWSQTCVCLFAFSCLAGLPWLLVQQSRRRHVPGYRLCVYGQQARAR